MALVTAAADRQTSCCRLARPTGETTAAAPHRTQCKRATTSRRLLPSAPAPAPVATTPRHLYVREPSTPGYHLHTAHQRCGANSWGFDASLRFPSIDMAQDSDQAGAGAGAGPPPAPTTAGVAGAMTLGGILTVAGILLLFVFFAIGIVSLQCCFNAWDRESRQGEQSRRRRRRGTRTTDGSSGGVRTSRGVDPELLRSLPVTVYKLAPQGADKGQQDAVECAVCLAELQDGEEARFLPRCGHGFHAECVDMWLASRTTCPLCRLTVSKPDDGSLPAPSLALPSVPPEPANYTTANLPASVLLGVSDHGAVTAGTGSTPAMVIEIPELSLPTPTLTPCDASKTPGSAGLRSIRRLWSFGRQGAGATSSCSCAGAGAGAGAGASGVDLEQGMS